jgi:hypothetical protein
MKPIFQNCKIVGSGVNSELYHSQTAGRGTPEFIISPSSLKVFAACPARWKAGYEPPASEAKSWGNLLDCALLTPDKMGERFACKPATYPDAKTGEPKPFNANSNWCKDWIAKQGDKQIVSSAELDEVASAVKRLLDDETIAAYHAASQKQVHAKGEYHDKATGIIVPVQCLIDFVPRKDSEFQKSLGDLKSTRNASQRPFAIWCYSAGYHIQAAFDLDLYMAAVNPNRDENGEDRQDWIFILQENYAPYETGRRLLGQDFIDIGRATYQDALTRYAKCIKTGKWGGYDPEEEFSLVSPLPYMEFNALSEKLERDQSTFTADDNDIPT